MSLFVALGAEIAVGPSLPLATHAVGMEVESDTGDDVRMVTSEPDQTNLASVCLTGVTAILDKRSSPVVMRAVLAAIVRPE